MTQASQVAASYAVLRVAQECPEPVAVPLHLIQRRTDTDAAFADAEEAARFPRVDRLIQQQHLRDGAFVVEISSWHPAQVHRVPVRTRKVPVPVSARGAVSAINLPAHCPRPLRSCLDAQRKGRAAALADGIPQQVGTGGDGPVDVARLEGGDGHLEPSGVGDVELLDAFAALVVSGRPGARAACDRCARLVVVDRPVARSRVGAAGSIPQLPAGVHKVRAGLQGNELPVLATVVSIVVAVPVLAAASGAERGNHVVGADRENRVLGSDRFAGSSSHEFSTIGVFDPPSTTIPIFIPAVHGRERVLALRETNRRGVRRLRLVEARHGEAAHAVVLREAPCGRVDLHPPLVLLALDTHLRCGCRAAAVRDAVGRHRKL